MDGVDQFQTLVINTASNMVSVSSQGQLVPYILTDMPFRVPADFSTASAPSGHTMNNTVPVKFITNEELLPEGFTASLPQGPRKFFAIQANLRYNEAGPLRCAIHLELEKGGMVAFNLVVGGGEINAKFPVKNFLNLEDRENGSDNSEVSVSIKPTAIDFPPNKSVTHWVPINKMFRELTISEGATVRWDSKQILTRYRFRPNMDAEGALWGIIGYYGN